MKKIIYACIAIIIQQSYAQKSISFSGFGASDNPACVFDNKLALNYYTTTKTRKGAIIDLTTMKEVNSFSGKDIAANGIFYNNICVNTTLSELQVYNMSTEKEATESIELNKKWLHTTKIVFDSPSGDYYIFIHSAQKHWWFERKSTLLLFIYHPKDNSLEKKELISSEELKISEVYSSKTHNDKIIVYGQYKKKAGYVVYNIAENTYQPITIPKKINDVYSESLIEMEEKSILAMHQANTTSKSIYYVHKTLLSIDLETAEAKLLGDYPTGESMSFPVSPITNCMRDRMFLKTFQYAPGKLVAMSVRKEAFSLVKITADEIKIIPMNIGTPLGYADIGECELQEGLLVVRVSGDGNVGGKNLLVKIDIDNETIVSTEPMAKGATTKRRFFYTNNDGVDDYIEYDYSKSKSIKIYKK